MTDEKKPGQSYRPATAYAQFPSARTSGRPRSPTPRPSEQPPPPERPSPRPAPPASPSKPPEQATWSRKSTLVGMPLAPEPAPRPLPAPPPPPSIPPPPSLDDPTELMAPDTARGMPRAPTPSEPPARRMPEVSEEEPTRLMPRFSGELEGPPSPPSLIFERPSLPSVPPGATIEEIPETPSAPSVRVVEGATLADWQQLWLATQTRKWTTLSILPANRVEGDLLVRVANALRQIGLEHLKQPITVLDHRGVTLGDVEKRIATVAATRSAGGRVLVVLDAIERSTVSARYANVTDAALLVVILGASQISAAAKTVEIFGKDRFLGTLVLRGAARPHGAR